MNTQRVITQCVRTIRPQYVCRRCQFLHSSSRSHGIFDNNSFLGRMKNLITTSKDADLKTQERDQPIADETSAEQAPEELPEDRFISIKGKDYEIAARPKGYKPAETWEGLESIGSEEWQKQQRDQGEAYLSFLPTKTDLDPAQWRAVLRHTLVEALLCTKHGLDLSADRDISSQPWDITSSATISVEQGAVRIRFANQGDEQRWVESFQTIDGDITQQELAPKSSVQEVDAGKEEAVGDIQAAEADTVPESMLEDSSIYVKNLMDFASTSSESTDDWTKVPLTDSVLKFAITKRLAQLTGNRISDMAISGAADVQGLYTAGLVAPKPKKLFETLQKLEGVSNITVHEKRRSAIDKDREVGRWKLIEEELIRRDLPVPGTQPKWSKNHKLTGQL